MIALSLLIAFASICLFLWCVVFHPLIAALWMLIAFALIPFACARLAGNELRHIGREVDE